MQWSYETTFRLVAGLWILAMGALCFVPYGWLGAVVLFVIGGLLSAKVAWWLPRVKPSLPVFLMLHSVSDNVVDETCANNTLRPAELERLIIDLKAAGYTFQTATEAVTKPCRRSMCLTFDDGYVDNYNELFPILQRQQVKATCFVTNQGTTDAAFVTPEQICEMRDSGLVEFGGHTACHTPLGKMHRDATREAVAQNLSWLQKVLGKRPKIFAYPCGEYTQETIDEIRKLGITYAFTMHKKMRPVADNPLCIHRQIIPRGKTPVQAYLLATRGKYKV